MTRTLAIPSRYNGPPESGNGGISAGRLAAMLSPPGSAGAGPPIEVTLRQVVPLDVAMRVELQGGQASAYDGDSLIASARVADPADLGAPIAPIPFADAVVAAIKYEGHGSHPYPTCFVCGPSRGGRDGLELFPGPVPGHSAGSAGREQAVVAGALVLRPEHVQDGLGPDAGRARLGEAGQPIGADMVWAALDCPGGWAVGLAQSSLLLGRITAQVLDVPAVGEHCVVVAAVDGRQGRKAFARSTAYGADGRELGRAAAVWIAVRH